jgi:hypothetical protein
LRTLTGLLTRVTHADSPQSVGSVTVLIPRVKGHGWVKLYAAGGRAQTTSRIWICIVCPIEVVVPAVLAIPKKAEGVDFSAPSIQKTDRRLAVNGAGFGNIAGGLPIPLLEDAGYDPETHPGTMLTPREMVPCCSRPCSFT